MRFIAYRKWQLLAEISLPGRCFGTPCPERCRLRSLPSLQGPIFCFRQSGRRFVGSSRLIRSFSASLSRWFATGAFAAPWMHLRPTHTGVGWMARWLLLVFIGLPFAAGAIVIRSDVDDAKYRIDGSIFPALADMPGEGHGALIAPEWVVTAAHAAPMAGMAAEVVIHGKPYQVERVFLHPGYKRMPSGLGEEALATGNPSKIHAFLAESDDIALIKLASPVDGVAPVSLYRGSEEVASIAMLVGKGATGNGDHGQAQGGSHRVELRRAFNAITALTSAISGIGSILLRRLSRLKGSWAVATVADPC